MTTATQPARRTVRFSVLSEILDDVDQVLSGTYITVGQWTAGEILEHLALAIDGAFDGMQFKAPWFARTFIAPFRKNSLLTSRMKAGFKLPKGARDLMPAPDIDLETAAEHLRRAVGRFSSELPRHPHPFLGKMTREEWVMLTLRHCELHLSFIVPDAK